MPIPLVWDLLSGATPAEEDDLEKRFETGHDFAF
jgi:hypothetical protein